MPPKNNSKDVEVESSKSSSSTKKLRALKGDNYKDWSISSYVTISLLGYTDVIAGKADDKYKIVDKVGSTPSPGSDDTASSASAAAAPSSASVMQIKDKDSREVFGLIMCSTEGYIPANNLVNKVFEDKHMDGRAAWFALEQAFAARVKLSWKEVRREIKLAPPFRQQEDEEVIEYVDRVRVICGKLTTLTNGKGITDEFIGMLFLGGLLPKFESRVMTIDTNYDSIGINSAVTLVKEFEEIHNIARKDKKVLTQVNQAYSSSHKQLGPCFKCNEMGHKKADCPKGKKTQGDQSGKPQYFCTFCKEKGHTEDRCFKKKNKGANGNSGGVRNANANLVEIVTAVSIEKKAPMPYLEAVNTGLKNNLVQANYAKAAKKGIKYVEGNTSSIHGKKGSVQEFYLDSGASGSMGVNSLVLENKAPALDVHIKTASKEILADPNKGDLKLKTKAGKPLVLKGVLTHGKLRNNLLSVNQLTELPEVDSVRFTRSSAEVIGKNGKVLLHGFVRDGMYVVQTEHTGPGGFHEVCSVKIIDKNETQLWHNRLGHRFIGGLDQLQRSGAVEGFKDMKFTMDPSDPCISCIKGKAHRVKFNKSGQDKYKLKGAGQQLVSDIVGPLPESYDGYYYGQVYVDIVAEYVSVDLLTYKSDAVKGTQDKLTAIEVRFGFPVKEFHTDGGSEFTSNSFTKYCKSKGINNTITVSGTPQHDGIAERMIRTLLEMSRSMMFHAGAPRLLWSDAIREATYILNRIRVVQQFNKTPQQLWDSTGRTADISSIRVWGCDAWMTTPKKDRESKLDSRAKLMLYLGHDDFYRTGYKLLDVDTMKVEFSRDVTFLEDKFTQSQLLKNQIMDSPDPDEEDMSKFLAYKTDQNELELVKKISLEKQVDVPVFPSSVWVKKEKRSRGRPAKGGNKVSLPPKILPKVLPKVLAVPRPKQVQFTPTPDTNKGSSSRRSSREVKSVLRYGIADYKDIGQALLVVAAESKEDEEVRELKRLEDRNATRVNRERDPALPPPNKKGEIKMPSQRCTSNNKSGFQCKSKTCNGEFCWNHLLSQAGLRIKQSKIRGAGKGLFAMKDFPAQTTVTQYTGDYVPGNGDDYGGSNYVFELSQQLAIDAARTNTAPGRMINDANGSGLGNNCTWATDHRNKTVRIVTTKLVKKGSEFFISYGPLYWPLRRKLLGGTAPPAVKKMKQEVQVVEANHSVAQVYDGDILIPQSYNEATTCEEKHNWIPAIESELNSLNMTQTWELVDDVPSERKAIGCRWVFAVKRDAEGVVVRYKARLVVKGYSQIKDQDYNETFAPVLDTRSLRLILALAAYFDLELTQFDVETAFLNAKVSEVIYMKIPQGLKHSGKSVAVRLLKSLYGLKQASNEWNKLFVRAILALGYRQLKFVEDCIFMKMSKNNKPILISIFVDDGVNTCHKCDQGELDADMKKLQQQFKIKVLGDIGLILGMRIKRDRVQKELTLDQEVYIDKILNEWGFANCKPTDTPEVPASSKAAFESNSSKKQDLMNQSGKLSLEKYGSVVGALQYLALASRPDISHAVNMLARDLASPTIISLMAVKRVLRYLCGTKAMAIRYSARVFTGAMLNAYSDADWAGEVESAKSTSGMVTKFAGGAISWNSKKQTIVALSSTEAEYIALCETGREVKWLRHLLGMMKLTEGAIKEPVQIHVDNQTAIRMAEDDGNASRRKHINVKYHWIKEEVDTGNVCIKWIRTEMQQADIFTKAVPQPAFSRLRDQVMGITID